MPGYYGRIRAVSSPRSAAPAPTGLAKGVALITVATYLTYAAGLITNAFIARGLSTSDFGRYSYVVWLCGWLVLVINNGLTTSGIRFVAELLGADSVEGARRTHGYLLRLSRFFEVAVLAAFVVGAVLIKPQDWQGLLPVFISVILVSTYAKSRYLFDISIAKGYGLFKIEAYSVVAVSAFTTVLILGLHFAHSPLVGYVLSFAVASMAYLLLAAVQLRRAGVAPLPGAPDEVVLRRLRPHLQWTTLLAGVAIFGNKSIEVFFLNAFNGPAVVGYFTIGAALTRGGIDLMTSGLMTVLMPVMSNAFGRGGESEVHRLFNHSVRYFAFAGLLAAGVGYFLATPTVRLMYGPSYEQAIQAFQVMAIISGLTLAEGAIGAMLSTTDRQRSRALIVVAQIAITVLLAAVLVPRFGFVGAIVSHAISRILGFILVFGFVGKAYSIQLPVRQLLTMLAAGLLAAAAAATLVWHTNSVLWHVLAAAAFCVLLPLMSLLFRCWQELDFEFTVRMVQQVAPSAAGIQQFIRRLGARFSA
jgi:O-antigen/teichoic acid export membrane protein